LKLQEYTECIRACDKALEIENQQKNEKCLFRRGEAYLHLQEYQNAIKDYQAVLSVNPTNSAAKQQIQVCKNKIKEHQTKEKHLYAKIFEKMAKQNNEQKAESDSKSGEQKPPTVVAEKEQAV